MTSNYFPTFTVKLKKRQRLNMADKDGLIKINVGSPLPNANSQIASPDFHLPLGLHYLSKVLFSVTKLLYIRKLHPGPFLNLILQSNILSKDLTALHIYEFLHGPPKGFISQLCHKTPQCMLGLFSHQVLFHSDMVFSVCRCLEPAEDGALTPPAHRAGLMPASPGICRTQHCTLLCHISKLICRKHILTE